MSWLKRNWVSMVIAAYLAVGMIFASALTSAIPAINVAGATYIALSWPVWLKASPVRLPIPTWAFTFSPKEADDNADPR